MLRSACVVADRKLLEGGVCLGRKFSAKDAKSRRGKPQSRYGGVVEPHPAWPGNVVPG